ncbi:Magnetosome membrane protein 22 [Candidatus Entotheonellaceae bacterium PAL068K]
MEKIETKASRANIIIKNYMLGALGVGIVPFPIVDMVALSGIQLKMLHSLANLYSVEFSSHIGKALITSLLGGGITASFSSNIVNLVKNVPLYGQFIDVIFRSFSSAASTYAIGKLFVQHFESGSTFLTFDPQKVRDYYAQQFEKGEEEIRKNFSGIKP